jgi:hypothetical protein
MAGLRAPTPASAPADLNELGAQWLRGLQTSHDAGCGCGGLFSPALDARIIEEDFLDYLFSRYEKEKLDELAAFIDARRNDATRGFGANSFDRWIVTLADANLADVSRARLITDIKTFVDSMGGGRRTPGVCY